VRRFRVRIEVAHAVVRRLGQCVAARAGRIHEGDRDELHELDVHQLGARAQRDRDTVARVDRGTGARLVQLRAAACRNDYGAGGEITPGAFRKIEHKAAHHAAVVVLHDVGEHMEIADTDAALVQLVQHHFGNADAFVHRPQRAHERAPAGHRHVILADAGAVPREAVALQIVGALHRLVRENAGERVIINAGA